MDNRHGGECPDEEEGEQKRKIQDEPDGDSRNEQVTNEEEKKGATFERRIVVITC